MSTEPSPAQQPTSAGTRAGDDQHRRFLIDLFGLMAYGELSAFERLSSDARFSPTLHDRATLGRLAVLEFRHFELVTDHLARMGADVETAMRPFQPSIDAFHDRTHPADWYESLMKAYVNDAFSGDFYRAVADKQDPQTRELIGLIQANEEQSVLLLGRLKEVLADDPRLASRLALWGRRLVGEALIQAQRVTIERNFIRELLQTEDPETCQRELGHLYSRLTANHSRRMNLLGLTA